MKTILYTLVSIACFTFIFPLHAQHIQKPIAKELSIQKAQHDFAVEEQFFLPAVVAQDEAKLIEGEVRNARFYKMTDRIKRKLKGHQPQLLSFSLQSPEGEELQLQLYKADFLTDDFKLTLSSGKAFTGDYSLHYWGIVNNDPSSLAAISIGRDEVMGIISIGQHDYILGKLSNDENDKHVLYETSDLLLNNPLGCDTEMKTHFKGDLEESKTENAQNTDNCVQMYIEVDQDIVNDKGGVTQATDYVLGAFSQVAILYANESIDFTINELYAWDTNDPYTGPSTTDYLYQFRDHLGGSYNGDLAHLVGYQGGGGVAYVDVLCNSFYGVGYSAIQSYYYNVPTYNWTVEVLTHEIGHNLGSPHTHDCSWNGNNTAIDGCGYQAGYGGCNGPIPNAGTIMSYCHLLSGVGIDFNLGFGPQPGDLIRNNVYNATCLTTCASPTADDAGISSILSPTGTICTSSVAPQVVLENFGTNTLSSVTIEYQVDNGTVNSYNWTGSLASGMNTVVSLSSISFTVGSHTFTANTANPNGVADEDPSNDSANSNFTRQSTQTYYADADGDGYGDPNTSVIDCEAPNGYVSNSDDCDDTNANIYPGGSCDDGDPCTINDTYDSNCICSGTYSDADGDGVCDANDICPGGDDTIDSDGDGIPDACDCNSATAQFNDNPLTHTGSGSNSTTYTFNSDDKDPSFTVSNMNSKTNGKPDRRFDEEVSITYTDGNGNAQTYGTYYGSNTNSVTISISGVVQSVTVSLADGYDDGTTTSNMSVSLSTINYCSGTPPCSDADNDGVCDANDVCPGFDDNLIGTSCDDGDVCTINDTWGSDCLCSGTYSDSDGDGVCDANDICAGGDDTIDSDGDGIPDFCDPSNCTNSITSSFAPDPLTHSGTGSSLSSVSFPTGNVDASFTVNGLGSKTNGNPNGRYIDELTITYVDGAGNTITYGTFNGDQQNSVSVSITGAVQSIELSLTDGYDGNTNVNMSVDPSTVSSCLNSGALINPDADNSLSVSVFPNPASEQFTLTFGKMIPSGQVQVFDYLGKKVAEYEIEEQDRMHISSLQWNSAAQFYWLRIHTDSQETIVKKVVIMN